MQVGNVGGLDAASRQGEEMVVTGTLSKYVAGDLIKDVALAIVKAQAIS